MNTNNKIHTFGDNNIELQNITARDINIITGKEASPEIKNKKQEIAETIVNLIKQLADVKNPASTENLKNLETIEFEDKWSELLDAIEYGECVLFIGQDIATDENGNCLHKEFHKTVKGSIKYNEQDGFFMPNTETKIRVRAMKFYNKKFPKINKIGYNILQKLAQIPFSLIISVSQDDTMHRIYQKYAKEHNFLYFDNTIQKTAEPTIDEPIIFNLLGNAAEDGRYIFTHKQFYDYILSKKAVKIPTEIETKIQNAAHHLFLGIDFNKWYNRLLLFALNIDKGAGNYSLNAEKINEINKDFIAQQFKVSFIDSNYNEFTEILIQKCKEAELYKSLKDTFIENTLKNIEKLKNKAIDTDSIEKLSELEDEIETIAEKIHKI